LIPLLFWLEISVSGFKIGESNQTQQQTDTDVDNTYSNAACCQ
jgi:hypothetical protein